jgi:hypothetical protein
VWCVLGEDAGLEALQYQTIRAFNLPICMRVGYHCPVHLDVVIITEIQEFFPVELSAVVGDDGFRNPEMENDVLDEIHYLLGVNLL